MSSFFKGKSAKTEQRTIDHPDYARVRSPYSQWLSGQIGKDGARYDGTFTTGLTDTQQEGMGSLKDYASQRGTPELMTLGADELKKTLTGDYDPSKGVYYKALRESAKRNLGKTQKNIVDYAGGGGRYYSGARVKQQSEADVDVTNALNEILGQMTETERDRRFQSAPMAANLAGMMDVLPAQRAENVLRVGDLERSIEQNQLDKEYADWVKSKYEYPLAIAGLSQNFQATKPPETYLEKTPAQPSPFAWGVQNIAMPLATTALGGSYNAPERKTVKTYTTGGGGQTNQSYWNTINPSMFKSWGKNPYKYSGK